MLELRMRTAVAKVIEAEYSKIEKLAAFARPELRESCRESLLARAKGRELKVTDGFRRHGQMALRGILLNVLLKQAKGQPYSRRDGMSDRSGEFGQAFPRLDYKTGAC